jgi:high-affinity iron transporter
VRALAAGSHAGRGIVIPSVYREGSGVVLFLQSIRLPVGSLVVLVGTAIGVYLTIILAVLTFISSII